MLINDGFDAKGEASICLEAPPLRQCYTAPAGHGRSPAASVIQVDSTTAAILFTVASGGVSSVNIAIALLVPGKGASLEDLFLGQVSLSNQSDLAFWSERSISDALIFVTAEYVLGRSESHYGDHRYMISAYLFMPSSDFIPADYYRQDRYLTTRAYPSEFKVLDGERAEILARLGRLKHSPK